MSLYGQYICERQNKSILENESGFLVYYFEGVYCYIEEIFVVEADRNNGIAAKMADEVKQIAIDKNCKWLVGSVKPSTNGSTSSLKVLLAYGFKLYRAHEDFIWFRIDLEE